MDQMEEAINDAIGKQLDLTGYEKSLKGTPELENLKFAIETVSRRLVGAEGPEGAKIKMEELLKGATTFATGTEKPKDITKLSDIEYLGEAMRKANSRAQYELSKPPGILQKVLHAVIRGKK